LLFREYENGSTQRYRVVRIEPIGQFAQCHEECVALTTAKRASGMSRARRIKLEVVR